MLQVNYGKVKRGAYNAFDVDSAFGNGLSQLVQLNDVTRLPESAAIHSHSYSLKVT